MVDRAIMLKRIYDWCIDAAHKPYALWIMGAVAFAESSFFPVPPDVMLIPMSLARPQRAWLYALVCTVASVIGGMLGYAIGALLYDSLGHWLINFYGLADKVEMNHRISPEIRLTPTTGHTPGHVSVVIESKGETAIITGDMIHHPIQMAHPNWATPYDSDRRAAEATRRAMLKEWSEKPVLVIGTHFAAPTAGRITRIAYTPGKFLNADLDKASEDNERNALVIESGAGTIGVVQIAGLIARRIVGWVHEGQQIGAGERIGMIRFGSRVDVYLPAHVVPLIGEGQTAIAGETVLADLTGNEAVARSFRGI